jgi:anaerobic sulfite reductase subunit A
LGEVTEVERFGSGEFEELITNRGSMYGFLARIYRVEVDQELLDQMVKMDLSVGVDEPEISVGYRMLKGFLEHLAGSTLTDLAVEYARIFLGAGLGGGDGAYPYESVYTNPHRLVMQEARDQVLQIYREEGLDKAEEFVEPEDHITLELEFMAHLCQKTSEALKVGDKSATLSYLNKQKDFLEKHLIPWAPTFCADVERIAQTDFYKAVAKVSTGYLKMEQDLIGKLIDGIDGKVSNSSPSLQT